MSGIVRRCAPPRGTLLAALLHAAPYCDCFSLSLPLAGASAAADVQPASASASSALSAVYRMSADSPPSPPSPSPCDGLADGPALTAYMRAFYTSRATSPARAALPLLGLPALPPVEDAWTHAFAPGSRFGPFHITSRAALASSDDYVCGSEAALAWGPWRGVSGLSWHALLLRRGDAGAEDVLTFALGSLLWRAGAHGDGAMAAAAAAATAAMTGGGATGEDVPNLRLPAARGWNGVLPLSRVYARLLLAAAVDRHIRAAGLL